MALEDIRKVKLEKLERLRKLGINPYPADSTRTHTINQALEGFDDFESSKKELVLAGRTMAKREQGALIFIDIKDGSSKIQGLIKEDVISQEKFAQFKELFDIGDIVELTGHLFKTKKGEKTIEVKEFRLLTKALLPLPEKWHGLQDIEERYRKRYLDILLNDELRDILVKKAKFWEATRNFLKNHGFLEVETPTLEVTTGGAEARPFRTHHNDFDLDVYLRISIGELWQKRLMAAGLERTFEIGRAYRNEGTSPEHAQEFTNMEFYAAYMTFDEGKKLVQDLYRTIAKEVFGKTNFETRGHKFNMADDWPDLDYVSTVKKITGVDVIEDNEEVLRLKLGELGIKFEGDNRERMMDSLWKYCRKTISGPAFLVNHPKFVAPLSKEHPDNPNLTKTFQVIIAGSEIGRAHAELNDPIDQAARFNKQRELIEKGDEEAMMPDDEYVEMLEYGMPPTFGFGFGERFFAFLVDKPLRETQTFPLMKPR